MLRISSREDYQSALQKSSDAIRVARVLCLFFMAYVHVHLFDSPLADTAGHKAITGLIRDLLGRASVPLLSVISGFLMVGYFARKPFAQVVRARFTDFIAPMVIWNLVAIAVFALLGDWVLDSVNDVIPLTAPGFQHHLAFLRDMFVLALLTPVMIRLLKETPYFGLTGLLALAMIDTAPIILRPQILVFYSIGLFLGLYRLPEWSGGIWVRALVVVGFVALAAGAPWGDFVKRPVVALAFWYAAVAISRTRAIGFITDHLWPASLIFFLSHYLVARILCGVYANLSPLHHPALYTLAWLAMPPACYLAAMAYGAVRRQLIPVAARLRCLKLH